jgi:hypothetical protein
MQTTTHRSARPEQRSLYRPAAADPTIALGRVVDR